MNKCKKHLVGKLSGHVEKNEPRLLMTCATTEACHVFFSLLFSIPGTVCPKKNQ